MLNIGFKYHIFLMVSGDRMADKSKKELVKFLTEPVVKRALQLRAVIDGVDLQDVLNAALRVYLADQIREVIEARLCARRFSGRRSSAAREEAKRTG